MSKLRPKKVKKQNDDVTKVTEINPIKLNEISYMEFINMLSLKEKVLIVSKYMGDRSNVSKLYFTLFHDTRYWNNITISKAIIVNHHIRLMVRGKFHLHGQHNSIRMNEFLKQMKQIHFVNINSLELWMTKFRRIIIIDELEPSQLTKLGQLDQLTHLNLQTVKHSSNFMKMISMREILLLNNRIILRNYPSYIIINVEVNGKPKLIDFSCPDYTHETAYDGINIMSISWIYGDIHKEFLIKNDIIHNSPTFEVLNKISDEQRQMKGITFTSMAVFLNEILDNVEFIIMYGSDFVFNLLILEYQRNLLSLRPLQNKMIINLKQSLWKQTHDEKLDEMVGTHGTTIDKINRLFKMRCGN